MATSNTTVKKACSKCDKGVGIFTCDGCQQSFCRKHSDEHRQELAMQMDNLGQEHDILQRDINNDNTDVHPFLARIDTWEQESINKIRQVANQARIDLDELIKTKRQERKTTINRLTNELQTSRESEDYTEIDLKKWMDQLNELRQDLEQSNTIRLADDDDQTSVIRLIKVNTLKRKQNPSEASGRASSTNQNLTSLNNERFGKADSSIQLSENNLIATYSGHNIMRSAIVFGINSYTTGRHEINFQIENNIDNSFFIGIVTFSQADVSSIFSPTTTVNGWWGYDCAVEYGQTEKYDTSIHLARGDQLRFILDCDNRQISTQHKRTNQVLQLPIDIHRCPFPWKLVVGLGTKGNSLRIIH